MRPKACKACGIKFSPARPLQMVCGWECGVAYGKSLKVKRERKEIREAKIKAKSRSDWMREAQQAFNRFIRLRDAGRPCIACGRHHDGQLHAGHYRSTKAAPELRFNENNCHLSCQPCNTHLSGNIVEYRRNLVELFGQAYVDELEGYHPPKKYSIDDLKAIRDEYRSKCRELEKSS
jgi:5-methylcytosine-specific restriction endonuclease McrA